MPLGAARRTIPTDLIEDGRRMPAPDVTVNDLLVLLAVARTRRMAAAAAALGIDQSTVSRRLRRLESAFGSSLVVRSRDGWDLSTFGHAVVERAAPIQSALDRVRSLYLGEEGLRGTVRIAGPDAFDVAFAAPACARVLQRHPGITIELVTLSRPMSPRRSGSDLSISIGAPRSSGNASERLATFSLGLYASDEYLSRSGPISAVSDLRSHPLVFYIDALRSTGDVDVLLELVGGRVAIGSASVLAQVAATRFGAGVGLLPSFAARREIDLQPVLPESVRFDLAFFLAARAETENSAIVGLVRNELRREVATRASELAGTF